MSFSRERKRRGDRPLVEACELDTSVNLYFHSGALLLYLSSHSFLLTCNTLDKLEITLSLARTSGEAHQIPSEANRAEESDGKEKWGTQGRSGRRTRRWAEISCPFPEQRPIQLKLDQSTQMCLVSDYYTQHWVARHRQEILASNTTVFFLQDCT